MSLLARFDPGDAVTGFILVWLVQTSAVILLAAFCGRMVLRHRAEARHSLWLGTLVLVLISPAVEAVADRMRLRLFVVPLSIPGPQATAVAEDRRSRHEIPQADSVRTTGELTDFRIPSEFRSPLEIMSMPRVEPRRIEAPLAASREMSRRASAVRGGLTLFWAAVALAGLVRMALGWRRLAVLSRSAQPLELDRHERTLERLRATLGIAALPTIVTSATLCEPVAIGLFKPRVVLPEGLAEAIASDALHDVLVHECAHIVRRDAWVGLSQCLAGVLLWPHPLVHFLNGQLQRAREEVCDNHVLRCGNPRGYARTLLALTEQYLTKGAMRPGLGLLGARWTLADRVAGLLDTRRSSMTRATFRMKMALAATLAVAGLATSIVRLDRSARADGPEAKQTEPRAVATPAVWSVEGTVVDERGQPVAGAVVRAVPDDGAADGSKTAANGAFALTLGGRHPYIRGVIAETDGGARIGLVRFDEVRWLGAKDPVRIVLKPSRPVRVRVNDAAGLPVAGAAVEAIDLSFQTHATTGPDGTATLRVPADAKVRWVIGLKAGAGFDYFENYRTTPAADYPPLLADVSLILEGAHTARVNAVDSTGQAVPGVEIGLTHLSKIGKVSDANVRRSAIARATTDQQGFATFGWLPQGGLGAFHFYIATNGNYTTRDQPYYQRGGLAKLTAHLLRDTRLSGTVRFPDGRPAGGLLIKAEGGPRSGTSINLAARTLADGSYVLDAPSESSYIVTVVDETWAAPSLSNVIVREGRAQGGLDFVLTKGTLLHGQVSEAPGRRPARGAVVWLTEEGGPVAMDVRRSGFHAAKLMQSSTADANGRYHFRVGPGRYSLRSSNAGGTQPLTVEVNNEAEIVRDLALAGTVRNTYFSGVVLEKTPTGDRPVAGAAVRTLRAGLNNSSSPSTADDQGRFRMLRIPGEQSLYGVSPDRSLAGLMPLAAEADNVRLVISKAPMISGRVIDSNGTPQAGRSLIFKINSGSDVARSGHQDFGTGTDDQGRFKVSAAPVGSYVEVSVLYPRRPNSATPRVVVRFEVSNADSMVIPDLILPTEKPTN
jgi:beta-lactamase regulating signal transducer with metallopeptidase domain